MDWRRVSRKTSGKLTNNCGSEVCQHEVVQKPALRRSQFTLSDQWSRRLFTTLCRRYGLEPYRYRRQRHTTVVVRAPRSFVTSTLWPEFLQIKAALDEYLNEATERIIREEVYGNSAEAPERAE